MRDRSKEEVIAVHFNENDNSTLRDWKIGMPQNFRRVFVVV